MPFQSEAQRRFMWAKKPNIARKWAKKYGSRPENGQKQVKSPWISMAKKEK